MAGLKADDIDGQQRYWVGWFGLSATSKYCFSLE
jgi:hypothetical protein